MHKYQRKFNKVLAVLLSAVLTCAAASPAVYAVPQIVYPEGKDCVLVSDDNALFNVEKADVNGNIYAHDNIHFYGSDRMTVTGSAGAYGHISDNIAVSGQEAAACTVPDFTDAIDKKARYAARFDSSITLSETTLDISEDVYVQGTLTLDEVTLTGGGYVTAEGTIRCDSIRNEDSGYCVLYSQNGDIIINASSLTINGILYAPRGRVIFNVKHLTVNGGVYAEDIAFNGTELSLNKTDRYDTLVTEKLTVEAGPDREIYVGESLVLEGTANYGGVSYQWSGDESIAFEDAAAASTAAVFSQVGTYTVQLTGRLHTMTDTDTLTVRVNPDPSRTFTTTADFRSGDNSGTAAAHDALTLDKEQKTASEQQKSYPSSSVSGIHVNSIISKDRITGTADQIDIRYQLQGMASTAGAEEQGVDFVFLIDNSGSMSGEYLTNAQEAARTILTFMRPGDRYAISDLGRLHIGFTDDQEVLAREIDNVRSGSGSSEPDDGIRIVTELFDEQSTPERQKYIIILADGEAYDSDYSMESMKQAAQAAADRNIRIFALAMRNDIQNMQEAAIISKGIYKNAPDGATIKKFMEQFGDEIFNAAARNILFKTTVADKNLVDWESIAPAPSAVTEQPDGSAEIAWSFDALDVDKTQDIRIPVRSDRFAASGYTRLTSQTALYYNDKEGKGQKTYPDDITLPCDTYRDNGSWTAVYDSQREQCVWTGIYWNGHYPSDASADVYVSVSEDGKLYTAEQQIQNYTVPEALRGRYIRIRAELHKGSDGSVPTIDDITVISGTMKLSAPAESTLTAGIDADRTVYAARPVTLYAAVDSQRDSVKHITWTVEGTEQYAMDTADPLKPVITFAQPGTYGVVLKVSDDGGHTAESRVHIAVQEQENVSDIIFDDGTGYAPVKYTVEGFEGVTYCNYRSYDQERTVRLVTEDASGIAWVSVRMVPSEATYVSRWNEVWVYHVNEDLTSTFRLPRCSGQLEITAYDWSGQPYRQVFEFVYDTTSPTVRIIQPESLYPSRRFYTEDPYTVQVEAADDTALDQVVLYVNDEEMTPDENNNYTFTPTEQDYYYFYAVVKDKAGNGSNAYASVYIYKDTYAPYFHPFELNRYQASIGNEIIFHAKAEDNDTGMKSVVYTLNGEALTLDENDEYRYTAAETGEFIFKGVATDNRDNIYEYERKLVVTEDTQRPYVTVKATRRQHILVGTSAVVTVTASDNVDVTKIDVDVNGKAYRLNENGQFRLKATEAGALLITAVAYDAAGNSGTFSYRLTAIDEDTTPPTVAYYPSARYEYTDRASTIAVTSDDDTKVSSRRLYLDGKPLTQLENSYASPDYSYTDYYSFVPMEIGAGEHTLRAVTTDASGNKTVQEKTFVVADTTAPYLSFEGSYYFNTEDDVVLVLKITDNTKLASVTGTLNDQPITLQAIGEQELTIRHAAAGTYTYRITAVDAYGNERTADRTVVVRDTQKPVITLSDVEEEYIIPDRPVLRMTVTDNVAVDTVTVSMNNQTLTYDGKQIVLPDDLAEGQYTIVVTARDTTGNTASATIAFSMSMPKDTTPPVIEAVTLAPEHPEVGSPFRVYVKASDDSGSVSIAVTANGNVCTYENGAYVYTPMAAGEIVVTITASDPSGNATSIQATNYVAEDATPPVVTVDYEALMTVGEQQTITVTATDNKGVSAVALQMNSVNVALSNGQYVFAPAQAGEYAFTAAAMDAAGHIGTKPFTVTVREAGQEEDVSRYLALEKELVIREDVRQKADELKTAAGIYEYVKNNIRPQMYTGLRKGAEETYDQGGGNDIDTASLLIAMLRYRQYPARYVSGTVQYTAEELMQLTGAGDAAAAIDCINASGYDSQTYYTPSGTKLIRIAHTWAEAYVPLSECGENSSKKAWITLDGWYKTCTLLQRTQTMNDIGSASAAEAMIATAESIEKDSSAPAQASEAAEQIKQHFSTVKKEAGGNTVLYVPVIEQKKLDKLPQTPDFTIVSRSKDWALTDDSLCDTLTLNIGSDALGTYPAYELAASRVIVQYLPATEADQEVFDRCCGDLTKTGTSLKVVPCLTINGETIAKGSQTTLGQSQFLTMTLQCGGKTKAVTDELIAGSIYAVSVNLYDISPVDLVASYLASLESVKADMSVGPYSEIMMGTALDLMGKLYFTYNDLYEHQAEWLYNTVQNPDIAVGLFGYEFGVNYNGWTGQITGNLKSGCFSTDIDLMKSTPVSRTADAEERQGFILNTGIMSSYLEGAVWTKLMPDTKPISTVSVLAESMAQGVDVVTLNGSSLSVLYGLSLPDEVISDIRRHLDEGYTVTVPKKEITIGQWKGTGYMMLHPSYEENIFRLSGGINGGTPSDIYTAVAIARTDTPAELVPELSEDLVMNMYSLTAMIASINLEVSVMSAAVSAYTSANPLSAAGGVADALFGVKSSAEALYTARDLLIDYEIGNNLAGYQLMQVMVKQIMGFVWGIYSLAGSVMPPPISDTLLYANLALDVLENAVHFDPQELLIKTGEAIGELLAPYSEYIGYMSDIIRLATLIMNPVTGIPSVMKQTG